MRARFVRTLVLGAMVAALVAAQGVPLAAGEEDDHPVGYTIGRNLRGPGIAFCNFYKVDLTTAEAKQVNPVGQPVVCGDGLTFDDDGTLYAYVNHNTAGAGVTELVTIDLHNGAQHVVGTLPTVFTGAGGMTFDADGDLWLYGLAVGNTDCGVAGFYCLWEVNPKTAQTEFVGKAPFGRTVSGLAADCEDVLAITALDSGGVPDFGVRLDEVNTSNAALEKIVDLPGFGFPTGLDFEDDGDLWALGIAPGAGSGVGAIVYRIDPSDGTFQAKDVTLGGSAFNAVLNGLAVDPVSCDDPDPEPTPTPTAAPVVVAPTFTG